MVKKVDRKAATALMDEWSMYDVGEQQARFNFILFRD